MVMTAANLVVFSQKNVKLADGLHSYFLLIISFLLMVIIFIAFTINVSWVGFSGGFWLIVFSADLFLISFEFSCCLHWIHAMDGSRGMIFCMILIMKKAPHAMERSM